MKIILIETVLHKIQHISFHSENIMFYISENTFEQIIFFCLLQHSLLIHWYFALFLPRVPHIKLHFTERSDIAILQFLFLQYNVLAAHYQSHIYYYIHYVRIALKSVGAAIPLCCTPIGLTIYHNHWILKIKFYFAICKICTISPEEKKMTNMTYECTPNAISRWAFLHKDFLLV